MSISVSPDAHLNTKSRAEGGRVVGCHLSSFVITVNEHIREVIPVYRLTICLSFHVWKLSQILKCLIS